MLNDSVSIKGKRILILSALFPPDVIGGAEMSAHSLALWLHENGAEVGVLTTAKARDEVCQGRDEAGLKIWRVWMPRPYPVFRFSRASKWLKPIWHLQDHFDPRNHKIVARILEDYKPDFIHIHMLQGIGYNALAEIGRRRIPVIYFLHDLGLACIRMAMFKKDCECAVPCGLCKLSAFYKAGLVRGIPQLGFCSPSRANLEKLARSFPVGRRPHAAILNVNSYPAASEAHAGSSQLRILYVGRLHASKGVQLLLQAAAPLAKNGALSVTIVGSGPEEEALRKKYGAAPWCRFTGFISPEEISHIMAASDAMCVPSIWPENSPGVIVHALTLGLPVIGSDKGGIPELIEDGKNGLLFAPNDVRALRACLEKIMRDPALLQDWRAYALAHAEKFDPDYLGQEVLKFMGEVARPRLDAKTPA